MSTTSVPGLLKIDLDLHLDGRGWFKEGYQSAKLSAQGFPPFEVVQSNVSFNAEVGVTRGIHAEPWDKYISLAHGRAFAAIVDLREGPTFGRVETVELHPGNALFVPRGCGNSYQTTHAGRRLHLPRQRPLVAEREVHADPGVRPGAGHRLADRRGRRDPLGRRPRPPAVRVAAVAPAEPRAHDPRRGRTGRAGPGRGAARRHRAGTAPRSTSPRPRPSTGWDVVVNAAAWTDVDGAEVHRADAWRTNAAGPAALARAAAASTASSSCTSPASTCSTGPCRGRTGRTTRSPRCPPTVRPRLRATSPCRASQRRYLLRPTWVVGEGAQLRAHDARARRARDRARPSSTTRSAAPPSPPTSPRPSRRSCATAPRSATTTSPAAASPRRGPTSRARSTGWRARTSR